MSKDYYYIEDPRRPDVYLVSDYSVPLLFSRQDLARNKRDNWGGGGIVRKIDIAGLKKKFHECPRIHLDAGEEEPRKEDASRLFELG